MGTMIGVGTQKGGVGKTTLTIHLAVAAARAGLKVIVADLDPQANATSWLLDGDLSAGGIFSVLVVGQSLSQVIVPSRRWGLGILPGNGRTAEAMIFLAATGKPANTISQALRPLAGAADIVILDMPPSRAAGFNEILLALDWLVVPTQLERLSLEGVGLMAGTVKTMGAKGPRLLGVVPNMIRYTNEHKAQLDELVKAFGPTVWPPIPLSVRVAECCAYGDVLFDRAPEDKVTLAMGKVAERFLAAVGK